MGAPPQPGIAIYKRVRSGVGREAIPEIPSYPGIVEAYPNPFSAQLRVQTGPVISERQTLTLFDLLGRQVLQDDRAGDASGTQTWLLDTTSLAPGVYLLQIDDGTRVMRTTIVKAQ